MDFLPISIRGYQYPGGPIPPSKPAKRDGDRWYLVFDTETLTDASQQLRIGVCHIYKKDNDNIFTLHQGYLFYDPQIIVDSEMPVIRDASTNHSLTLLTVSNFIETVFLPWVTTYRAYCIGFNLQFDISRLAISHSVIQSGGMKGGFTLVVSPVENAPTIQIKQVNTRASLYSIGYAHLDFELAKRITKKSKASNKKTADKTDGSNYNRSYQKDLEIETQGYGESTPSWTEADSKERPYEVRYRGRFVDVATIAHVLFSRKFSLKSLCQHLNLDKDHMKQENEGHGKHLTPEYLEYAIKDVVATFECFTILYKRYTEYNLSQTPIERLLTEASVGKASLSEMGIVPLLQVQPDIDPNILGTILSSFYGGRSEIHARRFFIDGLYCDMLSMYPTVNALMNLWKFVIADGLTHRNDTEVVQKFLQSLLPIEQGLKKLQDKRTWAQFHVLCKVIPNEDVFPVRSKYAGTDGDENIGLNYLTCSEPLYFMLPDVIVSTLLTGKVPNVIEAIRFTPNKPQKGLRSIQLLGKAEYTINPYKDDMFKRIIEMRTNVAKVKQKIEKKAAKNSTDETEKQKHLLAMDITDSEQHGLKITANSTSYGIFAELIAKQFDSFTKVEVFSNKQRSLATQYEEVPGKFFHPLVASLITSASRLLLATSEVLADKEGLTWAFCDTDSMHLCNDKGYSTDDFIHKAENVQNWFEPLNPYDFDDKTIKLFKFEDPNYIDGNVVPLETFCISSKRYVLFHTINGERIIEKASIHGLGTYLPPYIGYKPIEKLTEQECDAMRPDRDCSQGRDTTMVCVSPFKDLLPVLTYEHSLALGISRWEYDLWHCILNTEIDGNAFHPHMYEAFNSPVRKQYTNTSDHLLNYYKWYNAGKDYREQVKPFNFYTASSVVHNPFWYDSYQEWKPERRQERWKFIIKIVRGLGGIRDDGMLRHIYKKLPKSVKNSNGVSFEDACKALEGKRFKGVIDTDKWLKNIDIAYTNYCIANDMEKHPEKVGNIHPIAIYNSDATPDTQEWIDRDTLETIDRSLLTTYADFLTDYEVHAESKFQYGQTGDKGFTQRRHITVSDIRIVGKEYHTAYESLATEGDVELGVQYKPDVELTEEVKAVLQELPTSTLSSVSNKTVKKVKEGGKVSSKVLEKLEKEVDSYLEEKQAKEKAMESIRTLVSAQGLNAVARQLDIDKAVLSKVLAGKRSMSEKVFNAMEMLLQKENN